MSESTTPTMREVVNRLISRGLLSNEDAKGIEIYLAVVDYRSDEAPLIRWIAAFGAWLTTSFLVAFILSASGLDSYLPTLIFGFVFLASGVAISRFSGNTFLRQLNLSFCITGNTLFILGFYDFLYQSGGIHGTESFFWIFLAQLLITTIIYPIYEDQVFRFLLPIAVVIIALMWILTKPELSQMVHLLICFQVLATGLLYFVLKETSFLHPLRRALAASIPIVVGIVRITNALADQQFKFPLWPTSITLTVGLLVMYWLIAGSERMKREWMVIAIIATIALGFAKPGIIVAVGLLVLGYHLRDYILCGLGYLSLIFFTIMFYALLDVSRTTLPWLLMLSGIILIVLRGILSTRPWARYVVDRNNNPAS